MERFFLRNADEWIRAAANIHALDGEARAVLYNNAIVLPGKRKEEVHTNDGVYKGGVCDSSFNFIAGMTRSRTNPNANMNCASSYVPDDEVDVRHESVVFGGVMFHHFGHALLETMSRLWYFAENPDEKRKVVFIEYYSPHEHSYDETQMLELMGIGKDQIEVIKRPTRFDEVLVPDETIFALSGEYRKEYIKAFEFMAKNTTPASCKKVYFTRSRLDHPQRISMNEEYYEEFFKRRGYSVFAPEQLPLKEQISLAAGAEEFVGSCGTITHLLLFASPNVRATVLNRTPQVLPPQLIVDAARGIEPLYVEATRNVLPTKHVRGVFLFCPNSFFKRYLDATGIEYDQSELEPGDDFDSLVGEYLIRWHSLYSNNYANLLRDESMSDIIEQLGYAIADSAPKNDSYKQADGISWLRINNKRLEEENKRLKRQLSSIKNSKSWRMTKWLRLLFRSIRKNGRHTQV